MYYMLCKKNNPRVQTPDRDTQGKLFNDCRSGFLRNGSDLKRLQINLKIFARNVTKSSQHYLL